MPPMERGGGGDQPEAGHGGVGGCDGVQADGGQVGQQGGEAVHREVVIGVLDGCLGPGLRGATGLGRAAWAVCLSSSVNRTGASRACIGQVM